MSKSRKSSVKKLSVQNHQLKAMRKYGRLAKAAFTRSKEETLLALSPVDAAGEDAQIEKFLDSCIQADRADPDSVDEMVDVVRVLGGWESQYPEAKSVAAAHATLGRLDLCFRLMQLLSCEFVVVARFGTMNGLVDSELTHDHLCKVVGILSAHGWTN